MHFQFFCFVCVYGLWQSFTNYYRQVTIRFEFGPVYSDVKGVYHCTTARISESVQEGELHAVSDSHKHVERMSRGLGFHGRENALSFSFIKVVFTLIILNKEFKNTWYRVCVIKVDCC